MIKNIIKSIEMKQLDYLDKIKYDKLPLSYKDNKKQFHSVSRTITKLNNRKQKIKLEIKEINSELKSFKKQQTELFNDLKFINKNYNPKCYINSFYKNDIEYLNLIIKHSNISKPIYLGKPKNVLDKMKPIVPNLTLKNIKTKLTLYFTDKVKSHLDYSNPKLLLKNKLSFSDLI